MQVRILLKPFIFGLLPLLTGCAATMLVGGVQDNDVVATVDASSFKPATRQLLQRARVLGVVANDKSSIKAADYFETHGGYTVKIDRVAASKGEMTGTERRDALISLCRTLNPDAAVMARVLKSDTGNMIGTMFTGRVKTDLTWQMEVYDCRSGSLDSFGGNLHLNIGGYNMDIAEVDNKVGLELGTKILAAVGPRLQGPGAIRVEPPKAQVPATVVAPVVAPASTSAPEPAAASTYNATTSDIAEAQRRLNILGYRVGNADGIMGRRTADAIRKFQSDNKLKQSGIPDPETIALLRQKAQ